MEEITVKIDGKEHKVNIEEIGDGKIKVHHNGETYEVETKADIEKEIFDVSKKKTEKSGKNIIKAPLPGTIATINVKVGARVTEGMSLLKLIAMKMENDILAEKNGVVKEIRVKKNESVNKDDVLMVIE